MKVMLWALMQLSHRYLVFCGFVRYPRYSGLESITFSASEPPETVRTIAGVAPSQLDKTFTMFLDTVSIDHIAVHQDLQPCARLFAHRPGPSRLPESTLQQSPLVA